MPPATNAAPTPAAKARTRMLETPNLVLRAAHPHDSDALFPIFSDKQVIRYWSEPPHASPARTREWVDSMVKSSQNGVTDFIITLKIPSSSSSSYTTSTITTNTPTSSNNNNTTIRAPSPPNAEGQAIGKIGIYAAWPSNEIGFLLSRAFWGRGLAYEALTFMLDYLFSLPAGAGAEAEALNQTMDSESEEDKSIGNIASASKPESEAELEAQRLTTLSADERRNGCWRYASITTDVDPRNAACLRLLRRVGFTECGYVERTYCVGGTLWVDSMFLRLEREAWLETMKKSTGAKAEGEVSRIEINR